MNKFQCFKTVEAFKLDNISGTRLLGSKPGDFADVSPSFLVKHNGLLRQPCYIVIYEDGYTSVSPAETFEAGYKEMAEDLVENDSAPTGELPLLPTEDKADGSANGDIPADEVDPMKESNDLINQGAIDDLPAKPEIDAKKAPAKKAPAKKAPAKKAPAKSK